MERTFIIIKPDAVQRGLTGEILRRYEARGLRLIGLKFVNAERTTLEEHYAEHRERPFFPGLIQFMSSGPIVVGVLEGTNAIEVVRATNGKTNPAEAVPGTIRGDLALEKGRNVVHGSDGPESAAREIGIWFSDDELFNWERSTDPWVFEGR